MDGNQDFRETDSYEKAKETEKRKKKKNFIGPAVSSITSVLVSSGALANLGRYKKKWPSGILICHVELL